MTILIYEIELKCLSCGNNYADIVKHNIADCTICMNVRNELWDTIFDVLDIYSSVDLFNKTDDDIIDIFLGKKWIKLKS